MKSTLKKELRTLISGNEEKQDILVVSRLEPGIYLFRGEKINDKELEELQKNYNKTVIFTLKEHENKT